MTQIAFIIHSAKQLSNTAKKLITECTNHPDLQTEQFYTNSPKAASSFAYTCSQSNFDIIIAVGGDGTINEIINGIMLYEGTKPALGIIPAGSGNDYIKSAKLSCNTNSFIQSILSSKTKTIDIGKITTEEQTMYFANIADIGFGGAVIHHLEKQRKKQKSPTYALSILHTFLNFKKPRLKITSTDKTIEGPVFMIAICIGNTFGNGLVINPQSKVDDGKLNITLIGNVSFFDYLKNIFNLKKGKAIKHPEVQYWTTKEIIIQSRSSNCHGEMDGELFEGKKLTFSILPQTLRLLDY